MSEEKIISLSLSQTAWKRFKRNKLGMFGFGVICSAILIVLLGPSIRPDGTKKSNDQLLELSIKEPGFTIDILEVTKNENPTKESFFKRFTEGVAPDYKAIPVISYKKEGVYLVYDRYIGEEDLLDNVSEKVLLMDVLFAMSQDKEFSLTDNKVSFSLFSGEKKEMTLSELHDAFDKSDKLKSRTFILGTDKYGRDLLSRLLAGTWISLSVGFISVLISLLIGISLGALAGYFRGWVDDVIMWFINVIWSIPTLLLVIAITLALGKDFWQVFVAVGLTMWVEVARVVRGQVMSIREKEFVEAGRALGFTNQRIIFRHVIPNVLGPVVVISAVNFAAAILIEAGLSYLGIGAQPPQSTWGKMISEHKGYIITGDAYLAILPGVAIIFMVLAFVLVGNALRDAIDAKAVEDLPTV